ncbi:MAG TPA: hypothetical protein VK698_20930, partial [Kofleriaceae bacterium]|nr:hypothetical protein [Kofleriaceae bacterium]
MRLATRGAAPVALLMLIGSSCTLEEGGPDDEVVGEAELAAGRTPPFNPDGDPQAEECLNSEGANTAMGRVHNRFLWCQRWFLSGGLGTVGPGGTTNASTFELEYTAVGYGRDDGQRDVRIFFRGDDLDVRPLKGSIRPESLFSQRVACDFGSCFSDPVPIVKPFNQWLHQWTPFVVSSDASDFNAPDKVLRHQWHFEGFARSILDPSRQTPLASGDEHAIRCDSAPYFRGRSAACIFDDVIPHLQYSTAPDSRVRGAALHIRCAQNSLTCLTYPEANLKLIPGTFVPGQRLPGLHRIPGAGTAPPANQRAADNRDEAGRGCNRVGRYNREIGEFPGLPAGLLDTSFQDCDEYPFASTFEGAARNGSGVNAVGTPEFSVLGVDRPENQCAGRELFRYYRDDRILYYDRDTFYVLIKDAPADNGPDACPILTDGDEFPGDDGTGGGFPSPGQTITLDAGPDVSGAEGGSAS